MLLLFLFFLKHCQTVFSYADSYHCVPFVQPISAGYVGQRGPRTSPFTTLVFAPAASSSSIRNGMQVSKMFIYKLHCFLFSLAFHGRMCSLQVLQTCLSFWFLVTCKCTWLCSPQKLLGVNFQLKFAKSWIYPADQGGQSHCGAARSAFHVDVPLAIYLNNK